jgi:hypothetical protein
MRTDPLDADTDGDGVLDGPAMGTSPPPAAAGPDNCPMIANLDQVNSDAMPMGNGIAIAGDDTTVPNADARGDVCDPDDDNDGLPDGVDADPGTPRDATIDDDGDGLWAVGCYGGTDADDDGVSWDTDCNGKRDGAPADCGSASQDADGDGLFDAWETCHWGTLNFSSDSDADGLRDCIEAFDVNGNGMLTAGDATFVMQSVFGLGPVDWVFDANGNGFITTADGVLIRRAFFGLSPC